MPTKLFSLMSAVVIGLTVITSQLSARFTLTVEPSRVAMVAVLPSMAVIDPRNRVGGLCATAAAVMAQATTAARQAASRRTGVIGIPPSGWRTLARKPPGGCLRLRDGLLGRQRRFFNRGKRLDLDVDHRIDRHVGGSGEGALDRHGLLGIAADGDAEQPLRADDAVGRIEFDPARARQIDFYPGMGERRFCRAAGRLVERRIVEVAGD